MSQDHADTPPTDPTAADVSGDVLSDLEAKVIEFQAGWQRERADFANYKRRTEKELSEAKARGAQDAVVKFLPIIDDFERAMANVPADLQDNPWIRGVGLLLSKFDRILGELHVEKFDPTGQPFDPNRHEAIGIDPEAEAKGIPSGHVSDTLQKGYASGERVLRVAMVRVAP
ncbi:MAG: nucleotide exchange factor GrpE [Anaerolineae bacterium]|nr:nucleotide exchange factor GrpE [Anaerolineae bacterium]